MQRHTEVQEIGLVPTRKINERQVNDMRRLIEAAAKCGCRIDRVIFSQSGDECYEDT